MISKKVKKLMLTGLAVVMTAAFVARCGNDSKPAAQKKLVVGTNATFVPFEFKNDKTSDYDGFDIELIRASGKKMNRDV